MYEGQGLILWSRFSSHTSTQVLGIKLGSSGYTMGPFLLSHLAGHQRLLFKGEDGYTYVRGIE